MQEAAKKIWLFSYGADSPSINNTLWRSITNIEIDECYILTQRDLKYTLMHTTKRITVLRMQTVFRSMETRAGIKGSCVFGYEELSYGEDIWEHPGIKLMIEHMNNGSPLFEHWLRNGSLETNKRGLMSKFMALNNKKDMSKAQLFHYFQEYKLKTDSKILGMEQEYREMEAEIYRLRDINKDLRDENKLFREDNKMLRSVIERQTRR